MKICEPLQTEDYVVQPVVYVSPPKWHLGHTSWFFENFILQPYAPGYSLFHSGYGFVFNSYYESVGARVVRTDRGNLSRPSVADIKAYRMHVDKAMRALIQRGNYPKNVATLIELGLQHEQQHQELLLTDIKYILGNNPLLPAYEETCRIGRIPVETAAQAWTHIPEGVYAIGAAAGGTGFTFDNERERHKVYLAETWIRNMPVTNAEYLEFMQDGGYDDFRLWHAEGRDWLKESGARAPMYWFFEDGVWKYYTLAGARTLEPAAALAHISYYEAVAFAEWKGMRLPTEAEWETGAALGMPWGQRWEWTESAYLPYPGFRKEAGAIGEYNGKFMVNQMVLRGKSEATPAGHERLSYRNFFHPQLRWQFTGIRLCRKNINTKDA